MERTVDVIQELKKLFEEEAAKLGKELIVSSQAHAVGSYSSAEATAWTRDEQFYESD
jgi:hypothetical protein